MSRKAAGALFGAELAAVAAEKPDWVSGRLLQMANQERLTFITSNSRTSASKTNHSIMYNKARIEKKERHISDKPKAHNRFLAEFPELAAAYEQMGTAVHTAGPLDEKTRQLVKLALAIGIQREGAVHAHTRRALGQGITPAEIKPRLNRSSR